MAITIKDKTEATKEWTAEEEIQLFCAMDNLKPVGINKHFFMALIVDRLSKALKRDISSTSIWSHLETMYNLKTLDSQESLPFPNEEITFSLPEPEYVLVKREVEEPKIKLEPKSEPMSKTSITSHSKSAKHSQQAQTHHGKEADKKAIKSEPKETDTPKRPPKRTRGSTNSLDTSSPASTPPPMQKRRRI